MNFILLSVKISLLSIYQIFQRIGDTIDAHISSCFSLVISAEVISVSSLTLVSKFNFSKAINFDLIVVLFFIGVDLGNTLAKDEFVKTNTVFRTFRSIKTLMR